MKSIKTLYFGDSIMAADGKPYDYAAEFDSSDLSKICRGYPTLLQEALGLENIGNFAVGGHRVFEQKEIILQTDFKPAQLAVFSVGVNDFNKGTVIGTLPKTNDRAYDTETFYGAYCKALDHIFKSNPKIKVVLMTPLHRDSTHRTGDVPKTAIDSVVAGNRLIDFRNAILEIGQFYACPVADMYANAGLNRFNVREFTFEGVHPNNAGYAFIAGPLIQTIQMVI